MKKKTEMECKEFKKLIPAFVSGSLEYKTLKSFLVHMDTCEECKEELAIQILITEAMVRLEDGGAFDLQEEINEHMLAAKKRIRMHDFFKVAMIILGIAAIIALLLIVWLLVLRQGEVFINL